MPSNAPSSAESVWSLTARQRRAVRSEPLDSVRPDRGRRARLVSNSGIVLGVITAGLAAARLVLEGAGSRTGLALAISAVGFLLVPVVLQATRRVGVAGSLVPVIGLLCLTGMAVGEAGLLSEGLYWLPFVALAGMLMAPRGVTFVVTALALLLYPLLVFGHLRGWELGVPSFPLDFLLLHALGGGAAVLFAGLLGVIYERTNTSAQQRLWTLANHHELTGLPNRGRFREELERCLQRSGQDRSVVGLLLLDLDDFKSVNDTLGHATGDTVLCLVADRLDRVCGERELPCHLSGDEFTVILQLQEGQARARVDELDETLRKALAAPIEIGGTTLSISASTGSAIAADGESVDDLLQRADLSMYAAKRARSRVVDCRDRDRADSCEGGASTP